MLLLSGSTAAGNVPDGVTPGFLDFAEPWITALFAHAAHEKQPILFVPYARPGGCPRQRISRGRRSDSAAWALRRCARLAGLTDAHFQHIGGIFIGGGHTYTYCISYNKTGPWNASAKT